MDHATTAVSAARAPTQPRPDEPKEVLNVTELADLLGVDRKTVYDYAGRGVIPCRRLGRRLLFSRVAIMQWLSACKVAAAGKAL